MDLVIEQFLPKYPSIQEDDTMDPYSQNFYDALYNKKEFNELKLLPRSIERTRGDEPGDLLKHQKIVNRYMSSYTLYDSLLVLFEMGSGKACTAIGTIEQLRKQTNAYKGAIILSRNKLLLDNFKKELLFTCTKRGEYYPQEYFELSPRDREQKKEFENKANKKMNSFYQFSTIETFSRQIRDQLDINITLKYSNYIIVIDEAHHLGTKYSTNSVPTTFKDYLERIQNPIYRDMFRFLHIIKNKKVLLLTGTPMRDSVDELPDLLNLILPLDKQLPVSKNFLSTFMEQSSEDILTLKESERDNLKSYFKGYVTFLTRNSDPRVSFQYIGTPQNISLSNSSIQKYIVYPNEMTDFQGNLYKEAFNLDIKSDKKGIYTNAIQSSLMVFPDGSWGKKAFKKYMKIKKRRTFKGKTLISYTVNEKSDFKTIVGKGTNLEKLENLRKYSTKYASIIEKLLEENDGTSLIFTTSVKGGGLIVFTKILEEFGFLKNNGTKNVSPKNHYAVISDTLTTPAQISKILSVFNDQENWNGKYIKVIIGSQSVSEGITLKNVQHVHIVTPAWNFSKIDQALSRAYRLGSHQYLLTKMEQVTVKCYLHTSSLPNVQTIDEMMYIISQQKDIGIQSVLRTIKESSFDCGLTKNYNFSPGDQDYSRICNFEKCDYECDGNPKLKEEDVSTYQLFWNESRIREIIDKIKHLFRFKNKLLLVDILKPEYTVFEIQQALRIIIDNKIVIKNFLGFDNYLEEFQNTYYLVLISDNSSLDEMILKEEQSIDNILNNLYTEFVPNLIKQFSILSESKRIQIIKNISKNFQELLLEGALLLKRENSQEHKEFQNWMLEFFKNKVYSTENTIISKVLLEDYGILRCLYPKQIKWSSCIENEKDKLIELEKAQKLELEEKSDFYGFDGEKGFYIRDVSTETATEADDKRKMTRGQVCTSYQVPELIEILIKLNVPIPDEFENEATLEQLISKINAKKKCKKYFEFLQSYSRDKDIVRKILYWCMPKKKLCNLLRTYFVENNLMLFE